MPLTLAAKINADNVRAAIGPVATAPGTDLIWLKAQIAAVLTAPHDKLGLQ
jgi:hypothetical protein